MAAVLTYPRHMTHTRDDPASFLSEHAEIERIITQNFKANPHLHAKVFAEPFPSTKENQRILRSIAQPPPRNDIHRHGGRQVTGSIDYHPGFRSPPAPSPIPLSPTFSSSSRTRNLSGPVFGMRAANRSNGTLQLLQEAPLSETLSIAASETPSPSMHEPTTSRDAFAPNRNKAEAPPPNSISMRMYPSTPDILATSPEQDPRKLRRHVTVNHFQAKENNEDVHRYLQKRVAAVENISSPTKSRSSSSSEEDEDAADEDEDEDDAGSATSGSAPTLHATWHSGSSKTTANDHESTPVSYIPCDLPAVDRSPLFTEQETESVMRFLRRISANLSVTSPVLTTDRPLTAMTMSEVSWDSSFPQSDSRDAPEFDETSVIDIAPEPSQEPRSPVTNESFTASSGLQSFGPNYPYGRREEPVRDHGGGGPVKRNKTWTKSRDSSGPSDQTWSQFQQRRTRRDANSGAAPPPSRSVVMLQQQNQSTADLNNIFGDGVYHVIMPDLPRSPSLRLSSTTSLLHLEESIRHRQHMESKTSLLLTSLNPTPSRTDDTDREQVAFPTMHDSDSDEEDSPRPSSPPIGMRLANPSTRTLSTPFLYRPTRAQSLGTTTLVSPVVTLTTAEYEPEHNNNNGLKSFMDISADPETDTLDDRTPKQGKFKSFFSKAKAGIRQIMTKSQPVKNPRTGSWMGSYY